MKIAMIVLCCVFLVYANMRLSLPFEFVSHTNKSAFTENQCCCKGKTCGCAKHADRACKLKKPNHESDRLLVIKGAGCASEDQEMAVFSSFSKIYYLLQTNRFHIASEAMPYNGLSFLEIDGYSNLPLERPPQYMGISPRRFEYKREAAWDFCPL
jgi:hypothetical protein